MRTITLEQWKRERPERLRAVLEVDNKSPGRAAGRRPRDPEKERLLAQMDRARWDRYVESEKLTVLGPRRFRWRVDFK